MINPKDSPEAFLGVLGSIGAVIGIGKLLASDAPITPRMAIGRAISTAGIGMAAGAITLLFPGADPLVTYGVAAGLASLGTSALEAILAKWGPQ